MGMLAIIVKIMPEDSDVDLKKVEKQAEKLLTHEGAKNISFEIKPVAFGLNALMIKFAWQEEKDSNVYEDALSNIEGVSSVNTEEYRRAFG